MGHSTPEHRSWRKRWLPHPLMSIVLIYLWMALVNSFQLGSVLLGALLGIAIPIVTRNIWDRVPKIKSLGPLAAYGGIVTWDVIVANVQVAMIILFRPNDQLRPQWFTVPLDLRTREAVAILATTVSLTPGTVSCDLSADGRSLLVHALDTDDPQGEATRIKQRYEARLMRIFEC